MSGALSKLLRDLGKTVAEQQASRRGIDVRLSRAEGKAERASTRLRTLRVDAMQGRSGVARVSLLFGELSDEIEQAVEEATERAIEQAATVMICLPWLYSLHSLYSLYSLHSLHSPCHRAGGRGGRQEKARRPGAAAAAQRAMEGGPGRAAHHRRGGAPRRYGRQCQRARRAARPQAHVLRQRDEARGAQGEARGAASEPARDLRSSYGRLGICRRRAADGRGRRRAARRSVRRAARRCHPAE